MSKPGSTPTVLIVGGGRASAQAALDLAQAGVGVTLLTAGDWLSPGEDGPVSVPTLLEAARDPRINLLTGATVEVVRNSGSSMRVTVQQSPRYVDPQRCTACGACIDVCPVEVMGDNGGVAHKAIGRGGVPTVYAIDKAGMAPCRYACPVDQRAQGYVALIRAGNFRAAYAAIKRENPFPSVCGRVCNHRCEDNCTRGQADEPVAVMALKRFVAEWAAKNGVQIENPTAQRSGCRVAIVGAGPAGLSAARELKRLGHDVIVLEALPVAGGMMRVGIPSFRLPRERLQREIDAILDEGVELRTNYRVENVDDLFAEGYDAVVLAVGLHVSRQLTIPGVDDAETADQENGRTGLGVAGAVEFLRSINLGTRPDWSGRRVVVVGGGSTAMDAARICRRLGAEVAVVYRRSRAEMPAHDFEVDDAQREGVTLRFLTNPTQVLRQGNRVVAVECVRMELGEPDESGRRRPIPVKGSEFTLETDGVLLAIGQDSDLSLLRDNEMVITHRGMVQHDPATLMTARPGLFVAGDVAGTEGFVVDAIASGSQVARAVDRYLRGHHGVSEPITQPVVQLSDDQVAQRLRGAVPRGTRRPRSRSVSPATLLGDFEETEIGFSQAEAMAEASRCLSCGVCSECLSCVQACPAGAIDHEKQAPVSELQVDAVIWTDGMPGVDVRGSVMGHPGVLVTGDGVSLQRAVDGTLAHLGIIRSMPKLHFAAPSRWRAQLHASDGKGPQPQHQTYNAQYGVFLCRCGGEIERTVDLSAVAARITSLELPGLADVGQIDFACHPEGRQAIRSAIAAHDLNGAVLAACSCCALDQICYSCTTQRTRCKEHLGIWDGVRGLPLQFVNVREQCAFVHRHNPAAATRKAGDLVLASLAALSMVGDQRSVGSDRRGIHALQVPITAAVDPVRCRGCEDCEVACGLQAIQVVGSPGTRIACVDGARCLGCGVCMAVCSSGAILAGDISDAQAEAMLMAMGDLSDRVVVFSCNWGAYSALEAAGVERLSYAPSLRLIRLMCAGRAHAGLILRAFAQGAARVLVLACGHAGDGSMCHYHTGYDQARRSVEQAKGLLDLLGIDAGRLMLAEMQPGDGQGFVAAVNEFTEMSSVELSQGLM